MPPSAPGLAGLPGWAEEDHVAALVAFKAGCRVARDPDMRAVCLRAQALGPVPDGAAKSFFEFNFRPESLPGEGVLTGYFAPEYPARAQPDATFNAPVRPKPAPAPTAPPTQAAELDPLDLVLDGDADQGPGAAYRDGPSAPPLALSDRARIDRLPAPDALAWMRPEDLFFLQIQGSGVLVFPDGRRMKAAYAADNGRPFQPVARYMVQKGLLAGNRAGGETIRAWLAAHAGPEAEAVMAVDPRYVFFSLTPDDGREPAGAAGIPLTPGRALAVDPSRHAYGELLWIEASAPLLSGAAPRYRRLALALDTGSAIRGDIRADLYLGRGEAAGREAGQVRHTLKLVRLVPVRPGA